MSFDRMYTAEVYRKLQSVYTSVRGRKNPLITMKKNRQKETKQGEKGVGKNGIFSILRWLYTGYVEKRKERARKQCNKQKEG